MPIIADDFFVATAVAFGRSGDPGAGGAQFDELQLLRPIAVSKAMEAIAKNLMDGRRFAHTLPTGQLAGENDSRRVLDVEGHKLLRLVYQSLDFYPKDPSGQLRPLIPLI